MDAEDNDVVLPVIRWDGHTKTTSDWDGMKRDPDLWMQYGDTLIHLFNEGETAIGPSFRIPFSEFEASGYGPSLLQRSTEYLSYEWNGFRGEQVPLRCIFIELPHVLAEQQSFDWYITTRNFFAFCLRKPLLSRTTLGNALIALHERISLWAPSDRRTDLRQYLEDVGYRNFAHSPDHALSILRYAEYFALQDLWTTAFAHCVGMADVLPSCAEYMELSSYSRRAIEEAAVRLSKQMTFACDALANFLEEDMSPTHLGLTSQDRGQLQNFRRFLTNFYSKKFGLWPALSFYLFPKFLLLSVYNDFEKLYKFMVDPNSSDLLPDTGPTSGGVCVLQNLVAFDQRHGFKPLDHPLPLFPNPQSGQLKRRLSLNRPLSTSSRSNSLTLSLASFSELTHRTRNVVQSGTMVQAYQQFEEELIKPGKDYAAFCNGRKVRWILVYEILQILKSLIHSTPKEDISSDASYVVYWDDSTTVPWRDETVIITSRLKSSHSRPLKGSFRKTDGQPDSRPKSKAQRRVSFLPDCESDNYLENIEVKRQSWLQSWMVRESSPNAYKDFPKSIGSDEAYKSTPVKKDPKKTLDFTQLGRFPNVLRRVQSMSKSNRRQTVHIPSVEKIKMPEKREIYTSHSTMSSHLEGSVNGEVYVSYPGVLLDNYGTYVKIRTDLMGVSY